MLGPSTLVATLVCVGGGAVLAGCLEPATETCADGTLCPPGTRCLAAGGCATPAAIAACDGLRDDDACDLPGVAGGYCRGGACVISDCGNGVVDLGEACDDGNDVAGDGCAPGCDSNETCGNGVLDPAVDEACDDGNRRNRDGCSQACGLETANWRKLGSAPAARVRPAFARDLAHDELVMFGSVSVIDEQTWHFDGAAWRSSALAPVPSRAQTQLAYDVRRARMVAISWANDQTAETWTFDGARWGRLDVATTPDRRSGAGLTYDAHRDRVVLVGGSRVAEGGVVVGEVWEFDGQTWTQGPPGVPRTEAAVAYDPISARVIAVGGSDGAGTLLGTSAYDGVAWTTIPGGPTPRTSAGLAASPRDGGVVLMGGFSTFPSTVLDDTWILRGDAWTQAAPANVPPARNQHSMADGSVTHGPMIFGGQSAGGPSLADTWEFIDGNWRLHDAPAPGVFASTDAVLAPAGLPPQPTLVRQFAPTTWTLTGDSWSSLATTDPAPRHRAAVAYDSRRARLVMYGGYTTEATGETWAFDGASWTLLDAASPPGARFGHAMAYDAAADRIVMFGGVAQTPGLTFLADSWAYHDDTWTSLDVGSPGAVRDHALAYDAAQDRVVLFGGYRDVEILSETWELAAGAWRQLAPPVSPSRRSAHSLTYDPRRGTVVVFGGTTSGGALGDTWELSGARWTQLATFAAPPGRGQHVATYDLSSARLVLTGGQGDAGIVSDTWVLAYAGAMAIEGCDTGRDLDGDGQIACADEDCQARCAPACTGRDAEFGLCEAAAPQCGDGACASWEAPRLCPADCPAPPAVQYCGDFFCELDETVDSCAADCA